MCMIEDAEPCTWLGTDTHTARKSHRCCECKRDIAPGEKYHYSKFIQDGSFEFNKACAHCHAARAWLTKHCGGWLTESLREELEEHYAGGYRVDGLPRLVVGVRRRWQGFNGQQLMRVPPANP